MQHRKQVLFVHGYYGMTEPSGFDGEDSSSTFLQGFNRMFNIYNLVLPFSLTYKILY